MSLESYRKGYEAGRSDTLPVRVMSSVTSILEDDDYNKGYADAAAGRPFDYYGQTEDD